MIVTIIRFPTEADADLPSVDEARARFGENASSYLGVPGLLWKAYLLGDDRRTVGGCYWWADRTSAEEAFSEQWRAGVTAKYGAPPNIEWFDAPVVVDNRFETVRVGAPPTDLLPADIGWKSPGTATDPQ